MENEITLDDLPLLQHVALARLHLKFTGDIHALLLDLLDKLNSKLLYHAGEDGVIDPIASNIMTNFVAIAWREYFSQYELRFQAARREAAAISLAALGYQHQYFAGLVGEVSERRGRRGRRLTEQTGVEPFYELLLADVLKITSERVYSDGFKLSQRIWNLDQAGLGTIQRVVTETLATGDSAWNAAKRLESALGAGQDCPRWTSTRLYKLTKTDIAAGDKRGLLRAGNDSPCLSKGVSYAALRLARNEIQIAHASMTDALFERMPWVEMEQINLSPSHPSIDCECEDVVVGGQNGDGVYPVGTIGLPLHVHCMCYKTAVLMKDKDFTDNLQGWMTQGQPWPAMDDYAAWSGAPGKSFDLWDAATVGALASSFLLWLGDDKGEHEEALADG